MSAIVDFKFRPVMSQAFIGFELTERVRHKPQGTPPAESRNVTPNLAPYNRYNLQSLPRFSQLRHSTVTADPVFTDAKNRVSECKS